jgi:myo-inositol-1(or 4)-monophosphatase
VSEFDAELELARKAALSAGEILTRHWNQRTYTVGSKGRDNPVTEADLEADSAIKGILSAAFPDYGWLSEETADNSDRLTRRRVWIVDPLDGTKEFISGIDEFAIAIALAEDGVPVVGVTYNPIRREMFWAGRGTGCHLGDKRVGVTRNGKLEQATILASRSELSRGEWEAFKSTMTVKATGSVAYKLALVAAGMADATFTHSPKSEWDIASGAALVVEGGGRMSDIEGREMRFNQARVTVSGLIASNAELHDQLIAMARQQGQAAR